MGEENKEINMAFIKRVYGAVCGPDPQRSKVLYYRNTHPTLKIKIFVRHHWIDNGTQYSKEQTYVLSPNPNYDFYTPNQLDVEMGCMIPGPTLQEFHWDFHDAVVV